MNIHYNTYQDDSMSLKPAIAVVPTDKICGRAYHQITQGIVLLIE